MAKDPSALCSAELGLLDRDFPRGEQGGVAHGAATEHARGVGQGGGDGDYESGFIADEEPGSFCSEHYGHGDARWNR